MGALLAPLLLSALAAPASAAHVGPILVVDLGLPENYLALDDVGIPDCASNLSPFCYDRLPAAAVNAATLFHRQILYVGWTEGANPADLVALAAELPAITAFVDRGGGLVALSEHAIGNYAFVPGAPFGVQAQKGQDVVLTGAGQMHPSHAGLTTIELSGWQDSRHTYFTSYPSYLEVLSRTDAGWPVTLAGDYAEGCVFVTGMDPDWHVHYDWNLHAIELLRNTIFWASRCGCYECEPEMTVTGMADPVDLTDELPVDPGVLQPVSDDTPRFAGAVTVDLETCGCALTEWSLTFTTVQDVLPLNDGVGPIETRLDDDTFVVHVADADTYLITFTAYLGCPDGTSYAVTRSWYQQA